MYKNLIKMGISFILVFILMYFFNVDYSWNLIYILPVLIVQVIITLSISVLVAHIGVFVADSVNIMNVILRFLFYTSGVLYSVADRIPDPYKSIMYLIDPNSVIIEAYRDVILYHHLPNLSHLFYWFVIGILTGLYFISLMYKYENTYVKVVQRG